MTNTATIKTISKGRFDIYRVDPRDLLIKEDWNSRDANDPANREHINQLAQSIAENGVREPLTVYMEDGVAYVSDGHCRLMATMKAIEELGAEIQTVPCKTEDRLSNAADRMFSQIVRNSGKPFTPLETARVFKRLVDFGWSVDQIAKRSAVSVARVHQLLQLQAAPEQVQVMISSGEVSATLAQQVLSQAETPNAAVETLTVAVQTAKAEGKTRATAKHVDEPRVNIKKEFVAFMEGAKYNEDGDDVILRIKGEDYDRIRKLLKL
jgi:ParB family chromosome partitioning protein